MEESNALTKSELDDIETHLRIMAGILGYLYPR